MIKFTCKCGSHSIKELIHDLVEVRTHTIGKYKDKYINSSVDFISEQARSEFYCADCGELIDFDIACGILY